MIYSSTALQTNNVQLHPVLHPQHKLAYFTKQGWDKEWINIAETTIKDEFKHLYKDYIAEQSTDDNASISKKVGFNFNLSTR